MPGGWRRWYSRLAVIALVGLAIRLVYILAFRRGAPGTLDGDSWYYHNAANLLADGHGFIQPVMLLQHLRGEVQAADHPPGYIIALALPSLFGLKSAIAHKIWSALLGTATIGVVGVTGRTIAGDRVGLVAAGLAAVYPNFWINDGMLMSETLTLLTTALTVLAAYRFWERAARGRAAVLGAAAATLALTRGEGLLVLVAVVLPFALFVPKQSLRRRAALAATTLIAAAAVLAPWVAFNQGRFHHRVFITTSLGITLREGACDPTFNGTEIGYWDYTCSALGSTIHGDASDQDVVSRRRAIDYTQHHLGRLPLVVVARLGRTFGFFQPRYQLELDQRESTRDVPVAAAGLFVYYALVPAAIAGVVLLRRRRVPVFPLVGVVGVVALTVSMTFGQTRYRAPAEVPIVLLAAVGLDAGMRRWTRRRADQSLRSSQAALSWNRPGAASGEVENFPATPA